MLPQTNLQLYRALMDAGASEQSLVHARTAYDLARRLFVGYYRPSHKPFLCHLVGVAGALATWGQDPDVVAAGMLHSAYLYGNFGDGTCGATPAKRRVVRNRVGAAAEVRVQRYTQAAWDAPLSQVAEAASTGIFERDMTLIKLADLCDECLDAGPCYSPAKPLEFGLPFDLDAQTATLDLLAMLAGAEARNHFAKVFACVNGACPPPGLITSDRSYHVIAPGVDELRRSRIRLRLRRFARGFTGKRAA
jgi:hypothetical protein